MFAFSILFSYLLNGYFCNPEWIQIPAISYQKSIFTTESNLLQMKDISPIKYEDLEHIIGPGFEDELERYYEKHKKESEQPPTTLNYIDPWSKYDRQRTTLAVATTTMPESTTDSIENKDIFEHHDYDYYPVEDDDDDVPIEKPVRLNEYNSEEDSQLELQDELNFTPFSASVPKKKNSTATSQNPKLNVKKKVQFLVPKRVIQVVHPNMAGPAAASTSPFSFMGFMQFLKNIQKTFVTNTARNIQDKIKMLEEFRDKVLINIEDRIQALWPSTPIVRSKRGLKDSGGGGGHGVMDFPSSEAALMTISFLTFAVFLIKLVLQVINTIKSKHYSYNTFDTVNGGSTVLEAVNIIKKNRNARKLSIADANIAQLMANVLNSTEKIKLNL